MLQGLAGQLTSLKLSLFETTQMFSSAASPSTHQLLLACTQLRSAALQMLEPGSLAQLLHLPHITHITAQNLLTLPIVPAAHQPAAALEHLRVEQSVQLDSLAQLPLSSIRRIDGPFCLE